MARWTNIFLFIGCISCSPIESPDENTTAIKAPVAQNSNDLAEPDSEPKRPATVQLPDVFPPLPSRDLNDMVAGCAHQNPEKRPRGSNCAGIFPEQCGADKAKAFIGQIATPVLRERIQSFAPADGVRFILPMEAVTEDLRFGRLNVQMDDSSRIVAIDCY
jgi:Peptidase inhibitor I78 family